MNDEKKELEAGDMDEYGYTLIEERDALDRYDEYLNELGDVTIGGLTYDQAEAFKRIDPIAYRCGFNDWADGEQLAII